MRQAINQWTKRTVGKKLYDPDRLKFAGSFAVLGVAAAALSIHSPEAPQDPTVGVVIGVLSILVAAYIWPYGAIREENKWRSNP